MGSKMTAVCFSCQSSSTPLPVYTLFPTSLPQKCSSENCSTLAFCFLPLVESSQWAAQRGDRRDGKAGGDAFTSFPPCLIQDASGRARQPLFKDSRFSEAPSSITRPSLALSSPCVVMPSCFSIPGGCFGPDHTSVGSLFDKIYWQILLGTLSVPIPHPGSYLTHLDSEFLAGKGSDSCLIIFLKPSTVSMIGGIFRL